MLLLLLLHIRKEGFVLIRKCNVRARTRVRVCVYMHYVCCCFRSTDAGDETHTHTQSLCIMHNWETTFQTGNPPPPPGTTCSVRWKELAHCSWMQRAVAVFDRRWGGGGGCPQAFSCASSRTFKTYFIMIRNKNKKKRRRRLMYKNTFMIGLELSSNMIRKINQQKEEGGEGGRVRFQAKWDEREREAMEWRQE